MLPLLAARQPRAGSIEGAPPLTIRERSDPCSVCSAFVLNHRFAVVLLLALFLAAVALVSALHANTMTHGVRLGVVCLVGFLLLFMGWMALGSGPLFLSASAAV